MSRAWKGKWICTAEFSELIPRNVYHKELSPALYRETAEDPQDIHVMFRRSFVLNKSSEKYVLRVSADDYGKYYVNGAFVGQGPTPGYLESFNYNEFDITGDLRDGENEIRVVAGDLEDTATFVRTDTPANYKLSKKRSKSANWV